MQYFTWLLCVSGFLGFKSVLSQSESHARSYLCGGDAKCRPQPCLALKEDFEYRKHSFIKRHKAEMESLAEDVLKELPNEGTVHLGSQ